MELDRLLRWYALSWMDEAAGIEQLHDSHPGPSDLTGAPEWSQPFRHYLLDEADSVDDHGFYRKPLHAALFAVARSDHGHYKLLTRLRESWDSDLAAWRCGIAPDRARVEVLASLRNLRRLYQARAR